MTPFRTVHPAAVLSRSNQNFFIVENDFSEKKAALLSLVETLKRALDEDAREEEGYYDGADVKQLLNISDRTLYRWRQQNLVQFVKMGGKFFYPKHTIRQLRSRGKDRR